VLEFKSRCDPPTEITGAAHKGKRDGRNEGRRITNILGTRQQVARLVVDLNVPRLADDAHFAIRALVADCFIVLLHLP
jgi:hypothetical protein